MKIKTKRGARRMRNQRVINRSKCHNWRTASANQIFDDIDDIMRRCAKQTEIK